MRSHATSPSPAIESKIRRALPRLHAWYRKNRRPLPWRTRPTPYRTAVAEFMCQQTRITTVIPYFHRWVREFPNWQQLARSSSSRVLKMWEGLGYYRRARFLHALSKRVLRLPEKELPSDPDAMRRLPGIGDYTAGAIASIAFGKSAPAFDGNVARVLGRLAARKRKSPARPILRSLAARIVPARHPGLHNQALMELGALICLPKNPRCMDCPLRRMCPSRHHLPSGTRSKLPPTLQKENILVVRRGSSFWMTRNHPDGRWHGLLFFPTLRNRPPGQLRMRIRYPFTRYLVKAAVFESAMPPRGTPGRWMTITELLRATLPAPHRKILNHLGIG